MNTYTNASTSPFSTSSIKSATEAMRKLREEFPPVPEMEYFTHSRNVAAVEAKINEHAKVANVLHSNRIQIKASDLIPERRIEEQWRPPKGGRFCELGPEDECWARGLGIGTVEKVDMGMLIVAFKRQLDAQIMRQFMAPPSLPEDSLFSSFSRPWVGVRY